MADKTHDTADDGTRADRLMGREDDTVAGSERRGSTRRGSSRLSRSDYTRGADDAASADDVARADRGSGSGSAASATDRVGHSDAGATGSSTSTTAAAGAASSSARTDDERTNVSNSTAGGDVDNERTQAIDTERTQAIDTERTRGGDSDRTQPIDTERTRNQSRVREPEDRNRDDRLYRDADDGSERTRVQPAPAAAASGEVDRDAERERRRREREEALGTRRKSDEVAETEPVRKPKRTTDKFFGAFGLFLLRLVVAAIMGGHGLTKLSDIGSVQQMLSGQPLVPMPEYAAWVLAICEVLIAVAMVFGVAVRFAGLGTAVIAILALSLVKFAGMQFFEGYTLKGELELLLAAVGIMFLFVGGGSWGFDGALRRRKSAAKS